MIAGSDETALLHLMQVQGLGPKTLHRLLIRARDRGIAPSDLVRMSSAVLQEDFGMKRVIADQVTRPASEVERIAENLSAHEIDITSLGDPRYPTSVLDLLGADAPPVLFSRGATKLFQAASISCVGARDASPVGLAIAGSACAELARSGVNVVSGFANGVDISAHAAALESGGSTTLVLAEGILAFRPKSAVKDRLTPHNALVLSEFWPVARWTKYQAMQRNRTVVGLSRAMLVIESGIDGGTFDAATTALRVGLPLFVVRYSDTPPSAIGNQQLIEMGATPIEVIGTQVDVSQLLRACQQSRKRDVGKNSLFDD